MQLKPLVLVEENCFKSAYCLDAFCNFIKVYPREKRACLRLQVHTGALGTLFLKNVGLSKLDSDVGDL